MLILVLSLGMLAPPTISQEFAAHVRIHSPAIDNTTYDDGKVIVSASLGVIRKQITDYYSDPTHPVASDIFINCTSGDAYYAVPGKPCLKYAVKAGQCPVDYPGIVLPPDASLVEANVTANGYACDKWSFYYPIFQQTVAAWVSHSGYLVRFLGGRVATDYTAIEPLRPPVSGFAPPDNCSKHATDDAAASSDGGKINHAPPFPTELSANVSMRSSEGTGAAHTGTYEIWQSLQLRKTASVQVAQGQRVRTLEDASNSSVVRVYTVVGSTSEDGYGGTCYCLTASLPSPPEFEQWAATPSPVPLGHHVWTQSGYRLKDDNFTVRFDENNKLPLRTSWQSGSIRENKTYTTVRGATPDPSYFAVPNECAATACDDEHKEDAPEGALQKVRKWAANERAIAAVLNKAPLHKAMAHSFAAQ